MAQKITNANIYKCAEEVKKYVESGKSALPYSFTIQILSGLMLNNYEETNPAFPFLRELQYF